MTDQQQIVDRTSLRKWRTEIPNMYDDAGLDPFAFRLLVHYARVGSCWQSVRTTADICKMSVGQVVKSRDELAEAGFITVTANEHGTLTIEIVDRWEENFERFSNRSSSERGAVHQVNGKCSPGERGCSPSERKKEPSKKEPLEEMVANATSAGSQPTLFPLADSSVDGVTNVCTKKEEDQQGGKSGAVSDERSVEAIEGGSAEERRKQRLRARVLAVFEERTGIKRPSKDLEWGWYGPAATLCKLGEWDEAETVEIVLETLAKLPDAYIKQPKSLLTTARKVAADRSRRRSMFTATGTADVQMMPG